nr:hypothetical protein [Veillonella rogosae]
MVYLVIQGAAFNGWHLIVAPTLKRYKGLANWTTPVVACVMDSEIFKRNAFDRYVQGKVIFGGGAPRFVANRHFNSSSMLGYIRLMHWHVFRVVYTKYILAIPLMCIY